MSVPDVIVHVTLSLIILVGLLLKCINNNNKIKIHKHSHYLYHALRSVLIFSFLFFIFTNQNKLSSVLEKQIKLFL